MAFKLDDLFSRKIVLALIAILIAGCAIIYKLYSSGALYVKKETITDIYQDNKDLIITDTILLPDTTDTIVIDDSFSMQGISK